MPANLKLSVNPFSVCSVALLPPPQSPFLVGAVVHYGGAVREHEREVPFVNGQSPGTPTGDGPRSCGPSAGAGRCCAAADEDATGMASAARHNAPIVAARALAENNKVDPQ